ncbi:MAG: type II toxin-antitoxin system HicA family toxin [Victivallales bacterium]|nr:type II toxin-antitoxin system HicA family toxin [Victivallales bacterium]
MKRTDLLRIITQNGAVFLRNGGNHDIYLKNNITLVIPRHSEIPELLARSIIKKSQQPGDAK